VPPHFVTIDLGSLRSVGGFIYTPRQGSSNGRIGNYQVHYSSDATNWTLMTSGTWPNSTAIQRYEGLVGQRKARCQIGGPSGTVPGRFDVTVVFDMDVTDFTAADLNVTGGAVTGLRGSGYYYVATIAPSAPNLSISVPLDAANGSGLGSRASQVLALGYLDTLPPGPRFTGVPPGTGGSFQVGLTFDEAVTGLAASDFTLFNATLNSIVPNGIGYLLRPRVECLHARSFVLRALRSLHPRLGSGRWNDQRWRNGQLRGSRGRGGKCRCLHLVSPRQPRQQHAQYRA
jgi:hypothetical protein